MPRRYPKIKNPSKQMIDEARKMGQAKNEMLAAKNIGRKHILELEAEAAMYKHAMNLSEEMWKYYAELVSKTKNPSEKMKKALKQTEIDFQHYSIKYKNMQKLIKKRMG